MNATDPSSPIQPAGHSCKAATAGTAPPLWVRLRALFGRVIAVIGAPAMIAALTLAPRLRTSIVRQIALIEILARKLLLAEAALVATAPAPQRAPQLTEARLRATGLYTLPQPSRQRRAPSAPRIIDLANPETWPARFALAIPRDPRGVADRYAPRIRALWGDYHEPAPAIERTPPRRNSDAFLVARRAEALRRVLHDPTPHVTRLTRARRIRVARSYQAIRRYTFRAPRRFVGDRYDPRLTLDIFTAARCGHDLLVNTS
ncbi:MAG: hypothetical protein JNL81_12075 [Hyphomonadaceae bacterium]|nr:hypothetical protein [Hyphomonadaceae bacterium]